MIILLIGGSTKIHYINIVNTFLNHIRIYIFGGNINVD